MLDVRTVFQQAVEGLKEEWFEYYNTDWFNHIMKLPIQQRVVYTIVVFQDQVLNGGFHQYFVNGYGQFAEDTIKNLKVIGADNSSELLDKALAIVNYDSLSSESFREKLLKGKLRKLFNEDDLFDPLENLDDQFYDLEMEEDIESLLADYLIK